MLQGVELVQPQEIERQSFAIITKELAECERQFAPLESPIVKRVIHTTADFDYASNLLFSPGVVEQALEALRQGTSIVSDTKMVAAGINKSALQKLNASVHCFIDDPQVAAEAKAQGVTRSALSMDRGAALPGRQIFAIGNAPTALFRLHELIKSGKLQPELIIAVPVGFVNVVEAKQLILEAGVPYIIAQGRKGGSTVAAAICNALLYLAVGREV